MKRHRKGPSVVLKIKCPLCGYLISYEKFITRDVSKAEIRAFKFAGYKQIIPVDVNASPEVMAFIDEVVKTKLKILNSMYADVDLDVFTSDVIGDVEGELYINNEFPIYADEFNVPIHVDIPLSVNANVGVEDGKEMR